MIAPWILALLAAVGTPALQADELATCPPQPSSRRDPEERIVAEQVRVSCFKRALQAAASHLDPHRRESWDAEQATFDGWAARACALSSELYGLDLAGRRERRSTERLIAEQRCLQDAYGERGYLAKSLAASRPGARGGKQPFLELVDARAAVGASVRLRLSKVLAVAREAPDGGQAPDSLGPGAWESLAAAIDLVWQGAHELALRGCERGQISSRCTARLEAYYFSLVNPFENGQG